MVKKGGSKMPKKRLTTNGNVFRRTDGRWQSVIWYFDEQGVKRRKVFSSKTKTEAQQKITTYIAQFNAEVRNSDESQKTLKDSLTHWLQVSNFPQWSAPPTTGWNVQHSTRCSRLSGQNRGGYHRRRLEVRPKPLDGAGLRLHNSKEGTYPPERVLSLLDRRKLHPKEPYAKRPL